jgi:hypothetical protein
MAAAIDPFSTPAQPAPAAELADYPQFTPCVIPLGSRASRAFSGFLRPFSDDANAQRVLCALKDGVLIEVSGGRLDVGSLDVGSKEPPSHPLHQYLVDMAVPCWVLILDFPGEEHPRAYLTDPAMVPRFSECEHLRYDKSIELDGRTVPALCVYAGNLMRFDPSRSRLEQFLDQTSTYIAKYLIWLRTRELFLRTPEGDRLIRARRPNFKITPKEATASESYLWKGYWPGPSAPSGPFAHLATVKREDECWCWSGERYGECHRPREFAFVENLKRDWVLSRFTQKLMVAARSRLR